MAKRNSNPDMEEIDTYDMACELAERMDMKPRDADSFINNVMSRAGYTPIQTRDSWQRDDAKSGRRGNRRGNDFDNDTF